MTESVPMSPSPKVEEWQRDLAAGRRIELRRSRVTNILLALLMLGLAILFAFLARSADDGSFIPWFAAVCSLVAFAVFAYRGVSAPPAAIISPEGVSRGDGTNPIPWSEISDTGVIRSQRSRFVALVLTPQEAARRTELGEPTADLTSDKGETATAAFLPSGIPSEDDLIALIEIERQRRG
ncbi:hypothetical protein Bequi_00915 [Brachybacterium sp. JHP9]|uniref:PH domain-containing protein n=1 Tax=Brachybacterium equifaecis TaxID=2910770 RepID=A0ABT0QXT4_9MICO|nr:hypothetical protein [Brachybacterium equifaecis]MCL6421958.1 hypothetical protein [Brachybacterium equifaecis]